MIYSIFLVNKNKFILFSITESLVTILQWIKMDLAVKSDKLLNFQEKNNYFEQITKVGLSKNVFIEILYLKI